MTTHPPVFQSAAALLGLTSGVNRIDSILGGLKERTHMLIIGGLSNTLAERFCLRAIIPKDRGGFDTNPIFIDAGNCSDPYLFAHYARQYQINPKQALQRVLTSRAFTIYQLTNLIVKELPRILKQYRSRLIILADLLSMFNDSKTDVSESERIIEEINRSIQEIRDEENLVVISTITRDSPLAELLLGRADMVVKVEPVKNRSAIISLLRHPRWPPSSATFSQSELFRVKRPRYAPREVLTYG